MKHTLDFIYLEIAESIRRLIVSGELQAGDKLPPMREMARRWKCTPGTVSRAYSILAQEGLIEGRRGSGTRVKPIPAQSDRPVWHWALLVNRAEQFLLEAISTGHEPHQAQDALSLAISRWQDLQEPSAPADKTLPSSLSRGKTLRFVGSNDLLIDALARLLPETNPELELETEYTGSLGGLMALAQQKADLAGTHLWDESTDSYNIPFVQRLLPGRRLMLLTLAHRSLGLVVPKENPQAIQRLQDLERMKGKLINRQPGSGTRVWFDAQLKALQIPGESIPGYQDEVLTHLAVAGAVAQGEAAVGLGIYAAAAAYDLGFVPLTQERYDLVIPQELWHTSSFQDLVQLILSERFAEIIHTLGGYDHSETGKETWVS